MKILQGEAFAVLKGLYEEAFVDKACPHYINTIEKKRTFSDGAFPTGYLWDCLRSPKKETEQACLALLREKEMVYVFWDVHSKEQIRIPDYYRYPRHSCLQFSPDELPALLPTLPEDVYFFDDSLTWTVILTHEDDGKRRYCLISLR